ncbi:MAG: hypothetical protein LW629_05530 [Burkholderiales bacterium]|jgi:hypothetical protein|nr:hypothetical protein [Burkholderiales bacterium]
MNSLEVFVALVEKLGFKNKEKAVAFLSRHPGILGQPALFSALEKTLGF